MATITTTSGTMNALRPMVEPRADPGKEPSPEEQIRSALSGDSAGWAWLVEHYSPLLELQARYRLAGELRRLYDPEDLVNEVWLIAFRRLPEFRWPDAGHGAVLLAFLARTLSNKINEAIRRHVQRNGVAKELRRRAGPSSLGSPQAQESPSTSVLARAARSEARLLLTRKLQALRPDEREILVLRGIEGIPNQELARRLGQQESALAMRYRRALDKLRDLLPQGLLEDLGLG